MSDTKPLKRFVIVGNITGGQGKTLVSHLLAAFLREKEPRFRVMCADTADVDPKSGAKRSKLGSMVKDTIELGAGPTAVEVLADPGRVVAFWDEIGNRLVDSKLPMGAVLDVGANVLGSVLTWAESGMMKRVLERSVVVDLVVPCVASPKAIADALEVVRGFGNGTAFPMGRMFLVENAWQGPFTKLSSVAEHEELVDLVKKSGGGVATLPLCMSAILREIEQRQLFIGDVATWDYGDIGHRLGFDLMRSSREEVFFQEWIKEVRANFDAQRMIDTEPEARLATGLSLTPV